MEGVDLLAIKVLGGWKSLTMVQRYAHLSPDHVRAAVERLADPEQKGGTGTKNRHRTSMR